jgi:thioesterase domain-containing protein/acyl carrier protein
VGAQEHLASIFASVLGVERVGLDDDFFELGGDSLGVVELLAAVDEEFGVDLPASALLDAPTVAELSARLSHRRPRNASPLVELSTGHTGAPFFCVTGGGDPAISLRALARAMDGHDVVAIQPRGLEERARADRTIHAAARRNALALRQRQPKGPYRLGGYSYGATVAFEMACLLQRCGERVDLLVVLDAHAPAPAPSSPGLTDRASARLQTIRAEAPTGPMRRRIDIGARAGQSAARVAYSIARHRVVVSTAGLLPRRGLDQYSLFFDINSAMRRAYRPATTLDAPLLLVRSSLGEWAEPDFGWSGYVTGPITVVDVPGDHHGLIRKPVVERVGAAIASALG